MAIPRAYIACLASYNAGRLHGTWIDLDGSMDLDECIQQMLEASPEPDAEEWAVHDNEACGAGLYDPRRVIEAFEACEDAQIDWNVFVAFCEHRGEDLDPEQVPQFTEAYAGQDASLQDWCWQLLEDTGSLDEMPEHLRTYFNMEAYARDLKLTDVFTIEQPQQVWVFWSHAL